MLNHLLKLVQSHCLCLNDSLCAVTCNKTSLYLPVVLQPVTITCNLRHLQVPLAPCQIVWFLLGIPFQRPEQDLNTRVAVYRPEENIWT